MQPHYICFSINCLLFLPSAEVINVSYQEIHDTSYRVCVCVCVNPHPNLKDSAFIVFTSDWQMYFTAQKKSHNTTYVTR